MPTLLLVLPAASTNSSKWGATTNYTRYTPYQKSNRQLLTNPNLQINNSTGSLCIENYYRWIFRENLRLSLYLAKVCSNRKRDGSALHVLSKALLIKSWSVNSFVMLELIRWSVFWDKIKIITYTSFNDNVLIAKNTQMLSSCPMHIQPKVHQYTWHMDTKCTNCDWLQPLQIFEADPLSEAPRCTLQATRRKLWEAAQQLSMARLYYLPSSPSAKTSSCNNKYDSRSHHSPKKY
jgi:hypothetical protein